MAQNEPLERRLWLLGCYAATYCLPSAQVIWTLYPHSEIGKGERRLKTWLTKHWKGIVTRTERRCVRTPEKMADCLYSYAQWITAEYPKLAALPAGEFTQANYDTVWDSVSQIRYFGRYINIRLIEGLRRYCGIPARLYDIRSIGGWSPKRCLCYLYPQHVDTLLVDDAKGNALTNELAYQLLAEVRKTQPQVGEYVLAAMLCEYKQAFEKKKQFPGWTTAQEPDLFRKVQAYWGDDLDWAPFWKARADLFPHETLEEFNVWKGMRWPLARTLRTFGYNWTDLKFRYDETLAADRFADPVLR